MVGFLDLHARGQSDVTSAERRGVFGDLRLSRFLQSGEEESQCVYCVVSSFSLSFSELESVSVVCLLLIWLCCWDICFLYRFSLLIKSNWIFLLFYREGHGLAEKLLLIIFIFWQISSTFCYALILCAEALFPFWRKS